MNIYRTLKLPGYFYLTFFIVFSSSIVNAQEALTNESIIAMVEAKISKNIIAEKIKTSESRYDMGASGLVTLKKAKVPDQVMEQMLLFTVILPAVSNDDIIAMHKGGVPRSVILKKIELSETKFNVQTDGLIQLKAAKVPDPIVKIMMEKTL